jgi:hypothetical protein
MELASFSFLQDAELFYRKFKKYELKKVLSNETNFIILEIVSV